MKEPPASHSLKIDSAVLSIQLRQAGTADRVLIGAPIKMILRTLAGKRAV
jgi:hypothetical protein